MAETDKEIRFEDFDDRIEIHLTDGRGLSGPRGAPVGDFLKLLEQEDIPQIVGAIVNGELRELTYPIKYESLVDPVTMGTEDGMRIYRRSLTFLLRAAFHSLFPSATLTIDHSVSAGGYYCQVRGREPLGARELEKLDSAMREFVEADHPFERIEVPIQEAISYFEEHGRPDKVRLLAHRKKDYLVLYTFDGRRDYHHGYMVPSSGYIRWFELAVAENGFTLRFPRRGTPTQISPLGNYPNLLATFRRYGDWLERLGIESVGALNDSILEKRIREVILVAEALHEQRIVNIASQIRVRRKEVRVVLIAGPSSSGKTTASKRLSVQLLASGFSPFALELDKFFVDRDKTPRDEKGEFNYEHIEAIDIERLNQTLRKLIAGESVRLPEYDFQTGLSKEGEEVHLEQNQIIVLEGIHGLNPALLAEIPREQTFRIYISALTQLNLDRHNRVSTTDTRLIRRIVRDARARGYSPQETIRRWDSVRRGEKRYIFPFQENTDVMFNSALVYELAALKPQAEPLLRQVPHGSPEYIEVKRLLALLEWFLPCDVSWIPDNSLLREFLGGSILRDFKLWHHG
ncbi:MAG: nucleoside kinase [Chloroflexi bacterium]|nr:nucleoside kinase [Chloroflexota bacterium]